MTMDVALEGRRQRNVTADKGTTMTTETPEPAGSADSHSIVVPFLLGAAVGGVAGAVVGTLLGEHTAHAVAALINLIDRRLGSSDRDELRFDLLLQ